MTDGNEAHAELPDDYLDRIFDVVRRLPEDVLSAPEVANAVVELWRKAPLGSLPHSRYLEIWDRVWSAAAKDPEVDPAAEEAVGYAINDPAGKLTEELLNYLWPKDAKVGGGLPQELSNRLAKIVDRTDHEKIDASSVIVVSRLDILHLVAPDFAEKFVLDLLEWQSNPNASAYWSAFLWPARINPDLYRKIEEDLLTALERPERFEDRIYKILCQMFLLASMDFRASAPETTRHVMSTLPTNGLENMSSFVRQRMLNAKEDGAGYWEKTVQPWLTTYWPRDHEKRTEAIMKDFAMTAIYSGDQFPQGSAWFDDNNLLGPTPTAITILLSLRRKNEKTHEDFEGSSTLPERFPKEVLHLLWITKPFQRERDYGRNILDRIGDAQPELRETPEFQELDELLP